MELIVALNALTPSDMVRTSRTIMFCEMWCTSIRSWTRSVGAARVVFSPVQGHAYEEVVYPHYCTYCPSAFASTLRASIASQDARRFHARSPGSLTLVRLLSPSFIPWQTMTLFLFSAICYPTSSSLRHCHAATHRGGRHRAHQPQSSTIEPCTRGLHAACQAAGLQ